MPIAEKRTPRLKHLAYQGVASLSLPWAFISIPRLLMDVSVWGCRLPSVARCASSAARNSGSRLVVGQEPQKLAE